jgi:hypothetical protein
MSGTIGDPYAGIRTDLQQGNAILTQILTALRSGVAIQAVFPTYTFVNLPATAGTGAVAWCSNGRKGGEGVGAGTGVPVYWNTATTQWFTFSGNVLVTA